MTVLCLISLFQGVATAITASPDPFGIYVGAVRGFFWEGAAVPAEAEALRRFLMGIIGGTLAGYFTFVLFLIVYPLRARERWAHTAIASGLLVWFCVDSAMSLYHGALFNLQIVNIPTMILWSIPLILTRRHTLNRSAREQNV